MPFSKEMILGASGNQGAGGFYSYQIEQSCTILMRGVLIIEHLYKLGGGTDSNKELGVFGSGNYFQRIRSRHLITHGIDGSYRFTNIHLYCVTKTYNFVLQ